MSVTATPPAPVPPIAADSAEPDEPGATRPRAFGPDAAFATGAAGAGTGTSAGHASFVRWLLGGVAVLLGAVAALNWYVDATGVTSRQTRWQVVDNSKVRTAKVDLYGALPRPPQVVLLGSSRTMKFHPDVVRELTGQRPFNAAVSGAVPRDVLVFTKLVASSQPRSFPHLVWGLDVDAFRDKQLREGLTTDPRLQRFVPLRQRIEGRVATAAALTEWQTTAATLRSLRAGPAPRAAAPVAGTDEAAVRSRAFSAEGFQVWELPVPRDEAALEAAVRRQIGQYAGYIFERDAYRGIERSALAEFREVVQIANEHGDTPTIFLTPYHPLGEQLLARHDIDERAREVRATLRELRTGPDALRFEMIDLTSLSSFGGTPAGFYDGVHMDVDNTTRALRTIDRAGLLGAGPATSMSTP